MYTAKFIYSETNNPVAKSFTQEFPTTDALFEYLTLIADRPTEYIINLTDPKGRWAGQFHAGASHRDFPQN